MALLLIWQIIHLIIERKFVFKMKFQEMRSVFYKIIDDTIDVPNYEPIKYLFYEGNIKNGMIKWNGPEPDANEFDTVVCIYYRKEKNDKRSNS